jgi:hypothetical protein
MFIFWDTCLLMLNEDLTYRKVLLHGEFVTICVCPYLSIAELVKVGHNSYFLQQMELPTVACNGQ